MAISKSPTEPVNLNNPVKKTASEKKIQDFINKGGSATAQNKKTAVNDQPTKSIKLVMTADEMDTIKELRDKRPGRNRKITISVHDWVIEAIQEKIEREKKKYLTSI